MVEEKLCPKCGEVKPSASFYRNTGHSDGLSSYCRTCQVRDTKARYSPHPRYRAPEGQKWCPGCKTLKPIEAFGANRSEHDGKQSRCKPCSVAAVTASRHKDPTSHRRSSTAWRRANPERVADNHARWKYGVERGTYSRMLEAQGGRCAICGSQNPGGKSLRFHIDHCHDTGKVRALLCNGCNIGLGQFKHEKELLLKAVDYLVAYT